MPLHMYWDAPVSSILVCKVEIGFSSKSAPVTEAGPINYTLRVFVSKMLVDTISIISILFNGSSIILCKIGIKGYGGIQPVLSMNQSFNCVGIGTCFHKFQPLEIVNCVSVCHTHSLGL